MKRIQTVLGDISPEELGITMMHEHILWNQNVYQHEVDPDSEEGKFIYSSISVENMHKIRNYNIHSHRETAFQDNPVEAAEEAMHYKKAGGCAIVDCSCLGISRDPNADVYVAQETGLNIIMSTGMYVETSCPEVKGLSLEEKTALFVKELTEGVDDTGIKAGVIGELGVNGFTKYEQQTLAAGGAANKETGAAVLIHQPGTWKIGHFIVDTIEENGGNPEKIVLCHCDPVCDDIHYLESLLRRGVNLSFDQFGIESYLPGGGKGFWLPRDIDRIRAIARLCALGYSKQIVVSQDLSFKIFYVKNGGGGYAHILNDILPLMRIEGILETAIQNMLVSNPARILAMP